MARFLITFRIGDQRTGGPACEARQNAVIAAIDACALSKRWDDETGFHAIVSSSSIETIIEVCSHAIDGAQDLVLVLDAQLKAGRVAGFVRDPDLFAILPFLKQFQAP
jgi:hypothetical protein